jgi:cytoskeleton protein RodZ
MQQARGNGATVLQERKSRLAKSHVMMSSMSVRHDDVPAAPKAGADLQAARERIGCSVREIATALRIKPQYLEALETGRIGHLPGNAYAIGFLRTYASALGLDPNEITRRFKAEAATVTEKTVLTFPVPVPQRGVPAGAVVFLGVVLAIGAYAGWYRLSGEGKLPAETSAQIPAKPAIAPPAPVVAQGPPPPATLPAQQPVVTQAEASQAPAAPPVPDVSPSSAAAAALPVPAAPTIGSDQSRIVLRANADAWVQVRDKAGSVLLNRILHAGETWDVPPKPNLLLTTGNAGGTDLLVDGQLSAPLGASGAVRRDLPLDPDLIKDGKLAAASVSPPGRQSTQ